MSGAQTSTFGDPNTLLQTLSGAQTAAVQRNQLLNQLGQQEVAANNTEVVARAASALIDPSLYPTEEARAAAYGPIIKRLKADGYAPNAPDYYPGFQHLQLTARLGTPSADLYKYGLDRTAKGAIAPGDGGTTATGGTGRAAPATGGVAANAGALRDQLVSTLGVSPVDAGAILSNFHAESGLNAGINEIRPVIPGSRGGYGLAQWTGPRRVALEDFAQQNKLDVSQPATQLAFMKQELQRPEYAGVLQAMQAAQTPEEKAAIFFHGYLSGNAPSLEHNLPGHVARARAYAGLPAATATPTQPQGPPGASTAPGVVTGDAGRPGDVPPPPWGAPGAYGGGGFGAVVGRPAAVSGTPIPAGRPTGPPVITDQPAGGGVVAGPPGVATVGVPVPPGPAVAGDVAAINAGIAGRGGAPATDPNVTPTPARYAGTAPAPSVEAQPEAGWGTGIGSGYGPQNALAPPPVQPAPARPAVPATTAQPVATQPPAADNLPPLPAPTPPEPRNNNGLTAAQQHDINTQRNTSISAKDLQARVDAYRTANDARAEKFQADQLAYAAAVQSRQSVAETRRHTGVEEQRQAAADAAAAAERTYQHTKDADTQRLALETAARERAKAVDLTLQGGDDGSANYAAAYATKAAPTRNPDGSVIYPVMLAYDKPTYRGGKGQVAEGQTPDYAEQKTTPPTIMTAPQTLAAGYADRMRDALPTISDTSDAAMSRWQMIQGKIPFVGNSWVSPEFQQHIQAERNFITANLRRESGATIQPYEFEEARAQYIPQPGDKPPVLELKAKNRERVLANLVRDAGPAYKPPEPVANKPPSKDRPPLTSFTR